LLQEHPQVNNYTIGSCPLQRSVKPSLKVVKSRHVERYHQLPPSLGLKVFTDAHDTVTVEEGDRYPLGPPS